jgi:hypothetical protein
VREGKMVRVLELPGSSCTKSNLPGLSLSVQPAEPGQTASWRGTGLLSTLAARFEFSLDSLDSLYRMKSDGARCPIPLAEGDALYYARLDAQECAAEGRDSRILPGETRKRVELVLEAEERALTGA